MVGIHPNDASLICLGEALMLEQNCEGLLGRRCLPLESMAFLMAAENARTTTHEVATMSAALGPKIMPE